jgi:alpha-tubulin suppressor-like RCC1 family protein
MLAQGCLLATMGGIAQARPPAPPHPALFAWGSNYFGQLGLGTTTGPEGCPGSCSAIPVPVQLSSGELVGLAAGEDHALALMRDGKVFSWGNNAEGELGDGTTTKDSDVATPVCAPSDAALCPDHLGGVAQVAAGGQFSLALKRSGRVLAWGDGGAGQLGTGTTTNSDVPTYIPGLTHVVAVSAGGGSALALLRNGTVVAWGSNYDGQLGDGKTEAEQAFSDVPVPVVGLTHVREVSAGGVVSLALLDNGTVETWGYQVRSEFGVPEPVDHVAVVPEVVMTESEMPFTGVRAVAAGYNFSVALLKNGTVDAWGDNNIGELGGAWSGTACWIDNFCQRHPHAMPDLTEVKAIAAGDSNGYALLRNGGLMDWGAAGSAIGNGEYALEHPAYHHNVGISLNAVCGIGDVRKIAAGGFALAYEVGGQGSTCPDRPYVLERVPHRSEEIAEGKPSQALMLTGDNFTGATAVHIGATEVPFKVISSTSIETVQPPGACEWITVTGPGGSSPTLYNSRSEPGEWNYIDCRSANF